MRVAHGLLIGDKIPDELIGFMIPSTARIRAALDPLDPLQNIFKTRSNDLILSTFASGTRQIGARNGTRDEIR